MCLSSPKSAIFEPIEGYECKELTHIHKLYILNVIFSICGLCGNQTQKPHNQALNSNWEIGTAVATSKQHPHQQNTLKIRMCSLGKAFFTVTVFQNQKFKPKEVCVLKSLESLCLCHYVLCSQVVSVWFCCIYKQYHFELLFPLFMVRCRIIRKRAVVTLWSANSKKRTNS
jgi:hypothetical protein